MRLDAEPWRGGRILELRSVAPDGALSLQTDRFPRLTAPVVLHKSKSVSFIGTDNRRRESSLKGKNNIAQGKSA